MLLELFQTGAIRTPWPCTVNGSPVDGDALGPCAICSIKCQTKECADFSPSVAPRRCRSGLTFYQRVVHGDQVVVYGVLGEDKSQLPRTEYFKTTTKGRTVTAAQFHAWANSVGNIATLVSSRERKGALETLQALHDSFRIANDLQTLSTKAILRPGLTFEESFDAASQELRGMLKASEELVNEFDRIELLTNPSMAEVGLDHVAPFRLIDKQVRILNFGVASAKNRRLRLTGPSRAVYYLHDSFPVLTRALLHNALKYSTTKDIDVACVDEADGTTTVRVSSDGPTIKPEEFDAIFEKGYRGQYARRTTEGMGVGLSLAKLVADAHGISIRVLSTPLGYESNSIPVARNTFEFSVKSVPDKRRRQQSGHR